MTVLELATFACQTVGDISDETMDFAKRAVRLKYQTMYDAHAWRESMRMLDGYPMDTDGLGRIFLPLDAEEVIFLSLSSDGVNYDVWFIASATGSNGSLATLAACLGTSLIIIGLRIWRGRILIPAN